MTLTIHEYIREVEEQKNIKARNKNEEVRALMMGIGFEDDEYGVVNGAVYMKWQDKDDGEMCIGFAEIDQLIGSPRILISPQTCKRCGSMRAVSFDYDEECRVAVMAAVYENYRHSIECNGSLTSRLHDLMQDIDTYLGANHIGYTNPDEGMGLIAKAITLSAMVNNGL